MELEQMADELGFTLPALFETAYQTQPNGFLVGPKATEDYKNYLQSRTIPLYLKDFLSRVEIYYS